MPSWISLRTPNDSTIESRRAPFDPTSTDALVRAARSVRRRVPRPGIEPKSSVYVVLLDRNDGTFELYVGRTGLSPDDRYRKHKSRVKSSKWVRNYGIGLLPALYKHLNPMEYERSVDAEIELAQALRATGVTVYQA